MGVGVTTVHEAVDVNLGQAILLSDVTESENVLERRVYTTVRGQAHEVDSLVVILSVRECRFDFGVIEDCTAGDSLVDFYKVLIKYTAGTDVKVANLRVTHLTVRQTNVFAGSLELRMGIGFEERIPIGSRS
jgi:hypothetical protein